MHDRHGSINSFTSFHRACRLRCSCLLIQRGTEVDAQGSLVTEWSQSSGVFREDLGTVEAPLDSIDSECEKTK